MSWTETALLYFFTLFGCLLGGVGIGAAMGLVGIAGLWLAGGSPMWSTLADIVWNTNTNFSLVSIPLFVLMGEIILRSGIAARFYSGAAVWFSRIPGGLAQTNIAGCAIFSAVAGSSVATALTVGSIAVGEMRARGYADSLTLGTLTAGGCLGILIPPSIPLIVYGAMTSESVIDLFMAGVVPGLVLALLFSVFIAIKAWLQPQLLPPKQQAAEPASPARAALDLMPVIALIVVVIGGMYAGVVTPTEASALGCLMALLLALGYRQLTLAGLLSALKSTCHTSAVIMFITLCANILSYAVSTSGIGRELTRWMVSLDMHPLLFFTLLVAIYLVIGIFIDGLSIMLLTVPILYAPLVAMGFDGVWVGILIVVFIELGALSPPVGLNLFAIQSVAPGTTLADVAWSSMPYCFLIVGFAYLLYFFPGLVLWFPMWLRG